jgi:hypothetical protein
MALARFPFAIRAALLALPLGCGQTAHHPADGSAGGGQGGVNSPSAGSGGHAGTGAGSGGAGSPSAGAPSDCDDVQLADAAVESAVRERLGLGSSAPVGGEQLAALRGTLLVVNATSLYGLQCATSLGGLELSGGKLDDLSPLGVLPALATLTLRQTALGPGATSLFGLPSSLRELSFYDTAVADLTVLAELPKLTSLLVSKGLVTDLAPLSSSQLQFLNIDDNPLVELSPLSQLVTLRGLSLARTQVTSLAPLADLRLQELDVSGSAVTSLESLGAPRSPAECSHLRAESVPLSDASWAQDRERLCGLGWAVRASRAGDAAAVTCGMWCDIR